MAKKSLNLFRILSAIAIIICTIIFSCSFLIGKRVFADEKYAASYRNYDGVDYGGYLLDSENIDNFSEAIDLTSSDLITPIFQFVITPSNRGEADFEKLSFTFKDSTGKYFSVGFSTGIIAGISGRLLYGLAQGDGQSLWGENMYNQKWEVPKETSSGVEPGKSYIGANAAFCPYNFTGSGSGASEFYDKNGNGFTSGCNGLISIYYDSTEKAVYADIGYRWVDDDSSKPWTLTDKYKIVNGERRYRIRDLDRNDYYHSTYSGDVETITQVTDAWNGFVNPSEVTCTVSFGNLITQNPSILLVSFGGRNLADNYYVESQTSGVKNVPYPIPKPKYFSNTVSYDFANYGGSVKIFDHNDVELFSDDYTNGITFTPSETGDYYVKYSIEDPNDHLIYEYEFPFVVFDPSEGTTISPKGYDRDYVVYEEVDLGYDIFNTVQTIEPSVSLKISINGVEVPESPLTSGITVGFNNGLNYLYRFEESGTYKFEYVSTDLLGRETKITKEYFVSEYLLRINDAIDPYVVYSDVDSISQIFPTDYSVVNVITGNKLSNGERTVDIEINKDGGAFENYVGPSNFTGEGVYTVRYTYEFNGGLNQLTAERRIVIFKNLPIISVAKLPKKTVLASDSSLDDGVVKILAIKGTAISIPSTFFTCEKSLTVKMIEGDLVTDVTDVYTAGTLQIVLNNEGEYRIVASALSDNGYTVKKSLFITAEKDYIYIPPVQDVIFNVGHEVLLFDPEAFDLYGNGIVGGSFLVKLNGDNISVENGRFTPAEIGIYDITYSISRSGVTVSRDYSCIIIDTEAPTVSIDGVSETASKGKFVNISDYKVSDNSGKDIEVDIDVYYDGKTVSTYDGGFYADNQGEYFVRITATDMSGNSSVSEYKITVDKGGCSSMFNTSETIGLILLLSAIMLVYYTLIKKHKEI